MKEYKAYAKITAHFDLAIEEAIKFGGDVGKHAVLLFETMRNKLDTIPAADVVEVKHGRWIDTGYHGYSKKPIFQCSECHGEVEDYFIKNHKFCLHCGAKMDKEDA